MSDEDNLPEMPFLRNVGLIITYKCQVTCPHCILEAGPHRTEELTLQDAFNWIQQIASYRNDYVKVLSLTGGEPFYNLFTLEKIAKFGEMCGLIVSAVTNAYWAKTPEKAVRVLRRLPAIKMLAISTDVHHQESIPFENVKNAVFAAEACRIPYHIAVCTENEDDEEYKEILEKLREIVEDNMIKTAITFPAGRALKEIDALKYQTTTKPPISACSAGSSPIIFPDGRVIACIGPVIDLKSSHPLMLGNLREKSLEEIFDRAELNSILHAIRIWGPKKLISIIEEGNLGQHLPEKYIRNSVCNACYSLMSNDVIVHFLDKLAADLEFRRRVAYARVYYLNETRMVELQNLQDLQNF
jgi:MoaA/NifB/PqqE/SkfB family radical SAM enzyme